MTSTSIVIDPDSFFKMLLEKAESIKEKSDKNCKDSDHECNVVINRHLQWFLM